MESIKKASKLFPFEKALLTGEAELYAKYGFINKEGYKAVKNAAYADPYSARFLSLKMQYAFQMNDNELGTKSFYELKALAPHMLILKSVIPVANSALRN